MLPALAWLFVVALLALWSLAAWALQAVAAWTLSQAGALPGMGGPGQLPVWPDWVPPEVTQAAGAVLAGLGPVVEALLQAAPALAGGLTVAAWVVWGIGCALLLLVGAGLHLLIALGRRGMSGGSGGGGNNPVPYPMMPIA